MNNSLSKEELYQFKENGWVGSFPFLSADEVKKTTFSFLAKRDKFIAPKNIEMLGNEKFWFKSMHAHIPEILEIVTHPTIVERVKTILGENIILWGSTVTSRLPNQNHRWHVDVEHIKWPGVSVFIGLTGASPKSTLKVISKSHTFKALPPKLVNKDDEVLIQAKKHNSNAELVSINVSEGDFFIFDGLTWHGSENKSGRVRFSVIAQYTVPSSKIVIPANFDEPINWLDAKPPCVLVAGVDDFAVNNIVAL